MRNDGGGYVNSALDISSRFIANKALLTVEERGKHATTIDSDGDPSIALPVTVLVNQYTASASEITAGALQDDGIGMLVGARTFGKGVMQTLTPLPDGAAIKITTAHYLTPNRRDINLRGIDPDVRRRRKPRRALRRGREDAQLRAARRAAAEEDRARRRACNSTFCGWRRTSRTTVAVARERDFVHQAAHQEDSEAAPAIVRLTLDRSDGAGKPTPPSRTSMVRLEPSKSNRR